MSHISRRLPVGAEAQPDGATHFRVWAPRPREVRLVIERSAKESLDVALQPEGGGYFSALSEWLREEGDPAAVQADEGAYLYDVVDGEQGSDSACRPNQILAISLDHPVLDRTRGGVSKASPPISTKPASAR